MTAKEQLIAAALAVLAVAVPVIIGLLKLLLVKVERETMAAKIAKASLLATEARNAVLYAQERRLAEGKDGV